MFLLIIVKLGTYLAVNYFFSIKIQSIPRARTVLRHLDLSEELAASARTMSPVDTCVYSYFLAIFSHCVLLPAPGPPMIQIMGFLLALITLYKQKNIYTSYLV